jgi:ABC-type bacteriocin/lantibiotic exporter with double-glycine peptidase domain
MADTSDTITPVKRFWRLITSEKKDVTNIYVYALFNGLLSLSIPLGIQSIVNLIQSGTTSTSWVVLVILVLVGLTLAGIFQIYQLVVAERIQQRLFVNASMEFAYRIPRIKLSALKSNYPPELINRFFDIMTVQKGLYKLLFDFSVASLQIFFGLILLSLYHPFFIAFGFFLIMAVILFLRLTSGKGLTTSLSESHNKYEVVSWLEEMARNLSTFKMAGVTNIHMQRTNKLSNQYLRSRRNHFAVLIRQYYSLIVFKVLIAGGLLLLGGLLVFEQQMNIGQFIAAEIVIVQIISSVEKLVYSLETIYDVLTGLEKVGTITDLELENHLEEEEEKKKLDHKEPIDIKLHKVNLSSPQWGKTILKDLNLTIPAGQKLGVTGSMGAGKTSFMQLIAGLFDKFEGSLQYNGMPYSEIDLESLRSVIGDNLKQEEIFEGSIIENISLQRKSVQETEVRQLIELTGLTSFVDDLPRGLYTPLPSSGMGLASSTRNRILMARSMAGHHGLLLIEDNWFEVSQEIRTKWLDHLCFECDQTIIMASSNKEALKRMDKVILLEQGEIIRAGSFDEIEKDLPC